MSDVKRREQARQIGRGALLLVPLLALEGARLANDAPLAVEGLLGRALFLALLFGIGAIPAAPRWLGLAAALAGLSGLALWLSGAAWAGGALVALWHGLLLRAERLLSHGAGWLGRWAGRGGLAIAAGAGPVVLAQIEARFAEEEFFVAVEALFLSAFWLLALLVWRLWLARAPGGSIGPAPGTARLWLALVLLVLGGAGAFGTVAAYQRSFFSARAPSYPGVSAGAPFLCADTDPGPPADDGAAVFERMLALVEANPRKAAPEYGMLALATGAPRWAAAFREALLAEAEQQRFTGPSNSVKSVQYEASLRAYYYPLVRAAFPELFSSQDHEKLLAWFAAVNRRALTVEWVDWMYALAFSKPPEGPYENQENGAGLLALLEAGRLAPPELAPQNRDYLARNWRGWSARFRNTDDTLVYQLDWLRNAFFQSRYTGELPDENMRRSFDWLLVQALPDGAALRYNHPAAGSLVGVAYLGATLLGDERYLWLSARALDDLEAQGRFLSAQPGVERPVSLPSRSPAAGTCLVYGDSGLPNQAGPLAPDKIVFRDGWAPESAFVLLNLRFSGWHRYKATNTLALLYQDGPLVIEELSGQPFAWLPAGRSVFRDKRIPRENLNGLLVERAGLSAALHGLLGFRGPWAQDPPHYAAVARFAPGAEADVSTTVVEGWRGWRHERTVHFFHNGPLVVVDRAEGPAGRQGALAWHVVGDGQGQDGRIALRAGPSPAEMIVLPIGDAQVERQATPSGAQILLRPPPGPFQAATVFLTRQWVGAKARLLATPDGPLLELTRPGQTISLPLRAENTLQ